MTDCTPCLSAQLIPGLRQLQASKVQMRTIARRAGPGRRGDWTMPELQDQWGRVHVSRGKQEEVSGRASVRAERAR
jgi:hypothetical protein